MDTAAYAAPLHGFVTIVSYCSDASSVGSEIR